MNRPQLKCIKCFFCQRKLDANPIKSIKRTLCPSSKKSLEEVLKFIARLNQTEFNLVTDECLCLNCFRQVADYDTSLVNMLQKQRNLKNILKYAISCKGSDFESKCENDMYDMEMNMNLFEEISDVEIQKTINEVISYNCNIDVNSDFNVNIDPNNIFHKLYSCNYCQMIFKDKTLLEDHNKIAHRKYSCSECDFTHRNADYLTLHMNTHVGKKENQCFYCDKEFSTKISAIRHMEVHLKARKYQCDKCGICFSQSSVLYNHRLKHEAEEQPLKCELCSQVFKTKRTYTHHMITHRSDRPRYTCDICKKTFTEKYTLKVHKRIHNTQLEPVNNIDMDQSISQSIEIDYNNSCSICGQMFLSFEQCKQHIEKEHNTFKPLYQII